MAESENIYVRQDVFDARMDRMEALIEKNNAELKAYIDNSVNALRTDTSNAINALRTDTSNAINALRTETSDSINSLRADTAKSISELKMEIQYVGNEVRLQSTRIDSLENTIYWWIGIFGIVIASAVFLPALTSYLKRLFKPAVTIEDVERMINAAISRLEAK